MSEQLRTAAQAALEALEEIMGDYDLGCGRVQARALRAALAEPQPEPVTRDQIRDMVKECGIDWHRGFVPLFDGDDTNRYEVLVREVIDRYAAPQAQQHDCERRPYGDLRNAKWLDPECYAKGACQSLIFKQAQQPQPEPYCYIYEYDSVLGLHREFYPRQWNGYLPSRVVTLYAAPTAQQPQPEPVALRAALMRLADAADRVGVEHFDSDSLPPAVDLLNTETRAVHTLLKQSAGPQPEPVAHIDLVQNPMRPSYFIAGAADEHPAEQVLRALACWLGVGGYNAQTVDAKVFHRKIVDGVEQLMKSRAAPQVQHPLTDEQINQCISADKAFWHTAAKETGWSFGPNLHDFARAIEAAHGIGVKNGPAGTSHVSSET
jgi:hypothetical protein